VGDGGFGQETGQELADDLWLREGLLEVAVMGIEDCGHGEGSMDEMLE